MFCVWRCPRNMRSRVYVTVRCPSACPSVCPVDRQQQRRSAGLLLSALRGIRRVTWRHRTYGHDLVGITWHTMCWADRRRYMPCYSNKIWLIGLICYASLSLHVSVDSCGHVAVAVQQAPTLSSKCGQRHVDSRRMRLSAQLFTRQRVVRMIYGSRHCADSEAWICS